MLYGQSGEAVLKRIRRYETCRARPPLDYLVALARICSESIEAFVAEGDAVELHRLIQALPESEVARAGRYLRRLVYRR
jgi:hypothetical protein